jgi:hypothetical protein
MNGVLYPRVHQYWSSGVKFSGHGELVPGICVHLSTTDVNLKFDVCCAVFMYDHVWGIVMYAYLWSKLEATK